MDTRRISLVNDPIRATNATRPMISPAIGSKKMDPPGSGHDALVTGPTTTIVPLSPSQRQDFREAIITSGGATHKAEVTPEKEKEMVVLRVKKPLSAGPATVHITYAGTLNSEMRGLYLGNDDQGRKYAASQFEATDARRAFPSFDEPDYKATFDFTAVADRDQIAISNQKVASDTPGPGWQTHGAFRHNSQDVVSPWRADCRPLRIDRVRS
jgi:Peptidase M1 N-terminal domain